MTATEADRGSERGKDFLRAIVVDDLASGRLQRVATRFPPEPNGYLHIGHAKAICVDFGIARDHGGVCHLRYDDTNPAKEEQEYVDAIERDVRWLGFAPDRVLFASDYFPFMYQLAEKLVKNGKAYVCELTDEQIKEYRGTLGEPGKPSPQRDRSVDENLARLRQMKAGELPDGTCVLRAKIDMAASNMKMRDPLLYRIRHAEHHRTGSTWCIYPMYDFAHPISDAIEGITHSICTLEFENNRELYDWVIAETGVPPRPDMLQGKPYGGPPRQFEFARLAIEYTLMSKRKLLQLVQQHVVAGWDDPRMPTLAGLRRRGYTPEAIRAFCELVGVAKNNSTVDVGKLEYAIRDDLNRRAPRLLGVVRPLRVTLTNVDGPSELTAPLFPEDLDPKGERGARGVPFDPQLYIDRDDFSEAPPDDWKRLAPGGVVRLRHAGLVRCDEVVKDGDTITELRCAVVDESAGKPRGVIHWVSAARGVPCEVRLYDRLFTAARPDAAEDLATVLNPKSLEVVADAIVEPHVATVRGAVQLERVGYFVADHVDSTPEALVLNRVITLRDATRAAAGASSPAIEVEAPKARSARAATRPAKKTRAEQWAIAQERSPELRAHYEQLQIRGFSADEARTATTDLPEAEFCAGALAWADEHAAELGVTVEVFAKAIARWFVNELAGALDGKDVGESNLRPGAFAQLVGLATAQRVSVPTAKDVLRIMLDTGEMADDVIATRDLWLAPGGADLTPIINDVLAKHAGKVAEYRGGRTGLLGFFVGQVLKAAGGKADPAAVSTQVSAALAAG